MRQASCSWNSTSPALRATCSARAVACRKRSHSRGPRWHRRLLHGRGTRHLRGDAQRRLRRCGPVLPVHRPHRGRPARRDLIKGAVLGHFAEKDEAYTPADRGPRVPAPRRRRPHRVLLVHWARTTRSSTTPDPEVSHAEAAQLAWDTDSGLLPDPSGHHRRPRRPPPRGVPPPDDGTTGTEFGSNSGPMWLECPQPASEQSQNHPHHPGGAHGHWLLPQMQGTARDQGR